MADPLIVSVLNTRPWRNPRGKLGDFRAAHAAWLGRQISRHAEGMRHVCLSDVDVPGVEVIPLRYGWPGWWAKLEICRPDIDGDILYLDIDTVVSSSLRDVAGVGKTTVLRDFYRGGDDIGSGLMYLSASDRLDVWNRFVLAGPDAVIRTHVTPDKWGDQAFFQSVLGERAARWQDELPGAVLSYKADLKKVGCPPADASVVCFHGYPRPWNVIRDWIPGLMK